MTVGAQVLALLQRLVRERALTVLMITHDMDVIAECCDSATVLYAGYTLETGPTRELLAKPRHPYARALLAALPDAGAKSEKLASIEGHIPPPIAAIPGCAFAPRCSKALTVCHEAKPPRHGRVDHSWICHLEPHHG